MSLIHIGKQSQSTLPWMRNGGVYTGCKQHQRICTQICLLASSVDWAYIVVPSPQGRNPQQGKFVHTQVAELTLVWGLIKDNTNNTKWGPWHHGSTCRSLGDAELVPRLVCAVLFSIVSAFALVRSVRSSHNGTNENNIGKQHRSLGGSLLMISWVYSYDRSWCLLWDFQQVNRPTLRCGPRNLVV